MNQIDLLSWARAKAEGRGFAELVKELWSASSKATAAKSKNTRRKQAA